MNNKICLTCNNIFPISEFKTKKGKMRYAHCSQCRSHNQKIYLEQNQDVKNRQLMLRKKRKQYVLDTIQALLEKGCADCSNYLPDAMQFDHTCLPSEKLYNIAHIHQTPEAIHRLEEILTIELSKGEFVCSNCHTRRTIKRFKTHKRLQYLHDASSVNHKMVYAYSYLQDHACVDCNEKDLLVLEFDHVKGSKRANVSNMITDNSQFTIQDVMEEINKCQVRCSNCHRIQTGLRRSHVQLTTIQKSVDLKKCHCGEKKSISATMCIACRKEDRDKKKKLRYGSPEELIKQITKNGWESTAQAYNVSSNSLRKFLKSNY